MAPVNKDEILHDHNHDGIDRRGFLRCMAWAGTGALCVHSSEDDRAHCCAVSKCRAASLVRLF